MHGEKIYFLECMDRKYTSSNAWKKCQSSSRRNFEQMLPGMSGHELRKVVGENRTMRNRGKVVTRAGPVV